MLATLEVMPPLFEVPHDRQELLVVDLVVQLCWLQLLAKESHWVPRTISSRLGCLQELGEAPSDSKARGVRLQPNLTAWVKVD